MHKGFGEGVREERESEQDRSPYYVYQYLVALPYQHHKLGIEPILILKKNDFAPDALLFKLHNIEISEVLFLCQWCYWLPYLYHRRQRQTQRSSATVAVIHLTASYQHNAANELHHPTPFTPLSSIIPYPHPERSTMKWGTYIIKRQFMICNANRRNRQEAILLWRKVQKVKGFLFFPVPVGHSWRLRCR